MEPTSEEQKQRLKEIGLHYCMNYKNIVIYNEPACGKCSYATYPSSNQIYTSSP
jgi:hypothetical protein